MCRLRWPTFLAHPVSHTADEMFRFQDFEFYSKLQVTFDIGLLPSVRLQTLAEISQSVAEILRKTVLKWLSAGIFNLV